MKRVYLNAPYSQREEICVYRDFLVRQGLEVTSRWLNGDRRVHSTHVFGKETPEEKKVRVSIEDWEDLFSADTTIGFTEPSCETKSQDELLRVLGPALAIKQRVIVIGPPENVFRSLDLLERFSSWDTFIEKEFPEHDWTSASQEQIALWVSDAVYAATECFAFLEDAGRVYHGSHIRNIVTGQAIAHLNTSWISDEERVRTQRLQEAEITATPFSR